MKRIRPILIVAAALLVLVGLAHWLRFRATHVVAGYAFVKADVVQIGSPFEGRIAEVLVRGGQRVKAGDAMIRLDDSRERAVVEEASASLRTTESELLAEKRAILVERKRVAVLSDLLSANLRARKADQRAFQLQADHAAKVAARSAELSQKQLLPAAEAESAQVQANMLKEQETRAAELEQHASGELRSKEVERMALTSREAKLAVLESHVAKAKATLELAQARLDMTTLRAPKDGEISRVLLGPGSSVRASVPLLELWVLDSISIEAWVDESDLDRIQAGDLAEISVDAVADARLQGRIESFGYVTDLEVKALASTVPLANRLARARWMRVRITLLSTDARLFPGLTANVSIPSGRLQQEARHAARDKTREGQSVRP